MTLTAWKKEPKGRNVIWASDNLAAVGCYIDGYSSGSDVASTAEASWEMAAAGGATPWRAYVKNKWNAADGPSMGGEPALRGEEEDAGLRALVAALRGKKG